MNAEFSNSWSRCLSLLVQPWSVPTQLLAKSVDILPTAVSVRDQPIRTDPRKSTKCKDKHEDKDEDNKKNKEKDKRKQDTQVISNSRLIRAKSTKDRRLLLPSGTVRRTVIHFPAVS